MGLTAREERGQVGSWKKKEKKKKKKGGMSAKKLMGKIEKINNILFIFDVKEQ